MRSQRRSLSCASTCAVIAAAAASLGRLAAAGSLDGATADRAMIAILAASSLAKSILAFVSGGRGGLVYHVTMLDRNINHNEPGIGHDLIKVLDHNGIPWTIVRQEACCGMPKLELGDLEAVAALKDNNIPPLAKLAGSRSTLARITWTRRAA